MRARSSYFVALVVFAACRHAGTNGAPDTSGSTASPVADDEGVVVTFHGPPSASYTALGRTVKADAAGAATLVVDKAERTPSLAVAVGGSRPTTLTVALPEIAQPVVTIVATPRPAPGTYAIDAACSGDCTGVATFLGGQSGVHVTGTTGCSLRTEEVTVAFDHPPTRDATGALTRFAKDMAVSVVQQAIAGELPGVLAQSLTTTATFTCKGTAPRELHLTFAPGAAVTAVWSRYEFVGSSVKRDLGGHDRSSALVYAESDGHIAGLDLLHELVRFYGKPKPTEHVELVGKLMEIPRGKLVTCSVGGATFDVQIGDLALDVYDGNDLRIAHTVLRAPAMDCPALATRAPAHYIYGDGYDARPWRPTNDAIDAAMRALMR